MPLTLSGFKKKMVKELSSVYDEQETGALFRLIAEDVLGYHPTETLLHGKDEINETDLKKMNAQLRRLIRSEPIQYILNKAWFYDLEFFVGPEVLIPRQETEIMTDMLIKQFQSSRQIKILDIGTGSGCIAITLKKHLPESVVHAVDISSKAMEVAKKNAKKHHVKIHWSQLDILHPKKIFHSPFDIIASNPPYVRKSEKKLMHKNVVGYEPELALYVEDNDPLIYYDAIIKYCEPALKQSGTLALEINEHFGEAIKKLLVQKGYGQVEIIKDLNNKDRFIKAIKT